MGKSIVWSMDRYGYQVIALDKDVKNFSSIEGLRQTEFLLLNDLKSFSESLKREKPNIVISSLPYTQLKDFAFECVKQGVKYCDLGGKVETTNDIKEFAKKEATNYVFTDLGLAPGYVNILTEHGLSMIKEPQSVKMMVGGLPSIKVTNEIWNQPFYYCPLNYAVTWSVEGLINEYKDDCVILKNKKIETVKGMDGLEIIKTPLGDFEAFYTSGAMSHSIDSMIKNGVENCSYKTIRYKGHRDIVQWLIRKCNLNDSELFKIFENGCLNHEGKDFVIVKSEIIKDDTTWQRVKIIKSDDNFSAMQRATAFSISAIAKMMVENLFAKKKVLGYSDVDFEEFEKNFNKLESENH